jgi:hypothetical protein
MRFITIALAASRAPEVTPTTLTLADAYSHTPGHPLLGTASLASASTTTATTTQSIGNAVDDMLKDMCKDRPDDERCAKFTTPPPETTTAAPEETATTPAAVEAAEGPMEVTVEIKKLTEHEPKVTVKKEEPCEEPECPPKPTPAPCEKGGPPKPTPAPCDKGGKEYPCSFSAAIGLVMLALWAS